MKILLLFCAELLTCVLLGVPILCALVLGLCLFLWYGRRCGFPWKDLLCMMRSGIYTSRSILLVFLLIGMLTALWRACGTIPLMICCALELMLPQQVLLMSFLFNCVVSMLTGTAFGTAATMGTICMSAALTLGADPALIGGAILSGVYFGDRCSPVSTSALLVSELTRTDLYRNIRAMLKTVLVPFCLSCILFTVLGRQTNGAAAVESPYPLFTQELSLPWVTLLPAVLILVLSLLRVPVKQAMACSILAAFLLCVFVQGQSLNEIVRSMVLGYQPNEPAVAELLAGGGIVSMLRVAAIICISSSYAGIFRITGLLDPLQDKIAALADRHSPFTATLLTSLLTAMIACNQTLTILLTHQLCDGLEEPSDTAITLENTAVVLAPLVPWSIAGAVPLSAVGAPTSSLFFSFLLYLLPLWCWLVQAFRRRGLHTIS